MLLALATVQAQSVPTLDAMGEGQVTVPADRATVSVVFHSDNQNVTQAAAEVAEGLNRTIIALKAAGVKDEDMAYGYSSSAMSGQSYTRVCTTVNNNTTCLAEQYNATNLISRELLIRLDPRDQERVDNLLETARSTGASAAISSYSLSDTTEAKAEARKLAIEDARKNAEDMAKAFGSRLGSVLAVSEDAYPQMGLFELLPLEPESSAPGMVTVSSTVYVTYELL